MWLASCQPTTRAAVDVDDEAEEQQALPAAQVGEVGRPRARSATTREVRWTRSGLRRAVGSAIVVRHGLPPLGALDPCARISRRTRSRPTGWPVLRTPCRGAGSRRRSSWRHGPRGSAPSGRSSSTAGPSAGRWRGGSRRTPTRPGSCRSARRRSGRDGSRCSGSPRSVLVELLREKHRSGLQDLIRAAQLEVLGAQPAGSSRSCARRQIRALARVGLVLTDLLAQRLRMHPEIRRDMRDRPLALQRKPDTALESTHLDTSSVWPSGREDLLSARTFVLASEVSVEPSLAELRIVARARCHQPHPRLHRPPGARRGQNHARSDPLPQALPHPPRLATPPAAPPGPRNTAPPHQILDIEATREQHCRERAGAALRRSQPRTGGRGRAASQSRRAAQPVITKGCGFHTAALRRTADQSHGDARWSGVTAGRKLVRTRDNLHVGCV